MRVNHLNLCVDDLDEAQGLVCDFFDVELLDRKGDASAVMTDGAGFTLALSSPWAFGGDSPGAYPDEFHIGFLLATRVDIDEVQTLLADTGVKLGHAPPVMHGIDTSYLTALNFIHFEVACPV